MGTFGTALQPFLAWLLETTLVASVVICLILVLQKLLGHRLGPRWSHALWLVLLLRMVLPWTPPSPISLFSLIPTSLQPDAVRETMDGIPRADAPRAIDSAGSTETTTGTTPAPAETPDGLARPQPQEIARTAPPRAPLLATIRRMLPLLWLAGAVLFGGYVAASNFALWRIIKREHPLVKQPILELFEQCKSQMGVETIVALVPSDQVRTAALFGFVRPRLLLPREMIDTANPEELRYIFLHELAHLKRRDIYLGWLTSLLQVLHWFNPLVWLAFHQMRADRELACDALVLTRTHHAESHRYGQTMVALLERFSRSRPLPAMAGILESQSQLKRRITMIARFKTNSYRWSPAAVVLIVALAGLALPASRRHTVSAGHQPAGLAPTPAPAERPTFRKIRIPTEVSWGMQLSPDGRNVSLVSDKKLWVMPTAGKLGPDIPGEPVQLNTEGVLVDWTGHAWSADGKWIAFNEHIPLDTSTQERGVKQGIYIVSSAGGTPKRVCEAYHDQRTANHRISLSPEGKTLAFSSVDIERKEQHIYTIPVEGGQPKRLVDVQAREPVFSPDGKMIAFVEDSDLGRRGGGLWVVSAEGGTPKHVADAVNASSPVWSPVGDMIAFLDYGTEEKQINFVCITEEAGVVGDRIRIDAPQHIQRVWFLAGWSPDNKIAAIFDRPSDTGLYTLPAKGGKAVQVARGGGTPRWSPDGKRISCVDFPKKGKGAWRGLALGSFPAEGGTFTPIRLQLDKKMGIPGFGAGNRVSPDGKMIVFSGKTEEKPPVFLHNHIWTLPVEGGIPRQLTEAAPGTTHMFPCWSPDGKTVAFIHARIPDVIASVSDVKTGIYTIQKDGGKPTALTAESDGVAFGPIAWSPDGDYIAYYSEVDEAAATGMVRVVSTKGDRKSRIIGTVNEVHPGKEFAWSPDSKRIAFNGPDGNVISIMSVEDGSTVNIRTGLVNSDVGAQVDWSPDGERFVFVGGKGESSEFWVMENLLPQSVVRSESVLPPTFRKIKIASKPQNGVLSPDGNKLAFMSEGAVWVVPLHGKVDPDIAGEPVRLTDVPGIWDASGMMAWSADGKWIAVYGGNQSDSDKGSVVSVLPEAGGMPRVVRLPEQGGHLWSYRLSLSPDGQILAFSALELGKPRHEVTESIERYIYTIPTAGGEPKQVSSGWARMPSFSPDGEFIAYVGYRKREDWPKNTKASPYDADLWVAPSGEGTPVKLATVDGRLRGPVWSPDGKYIAAHHEPGGTNDSKEIWVFPLSPDASGAGEPEKIALPRSSMDMLAGWTPEGQLGVFLESEEHWAGYTVPASGGKAMQITPESIVPYYPRWSPDGERIYFRGVYKEQENVKVETLYVPAAGGDPVEVAVPSERRLLVRVPGGGHNISPDGKNIVFSAFQMPYDPKAGADVWTIPLDGGLPTRLTHDRSFEGYPCWSPDGEQIAFIDSHTKSDGESFNAIYIVPAEGGEIRRVSSESDNIGDGAIAFSPDVERIAFFSDSAIKTIPVEGGQPEVLVAEVKSGRQSQLSYSPDGSKIAHNAGGKIWITSLGGGKPEELRTGLPKNAKLSEFGWSPDGEKIAFIASSGGEKEFWLIENFLPQEAGK